MGFTERLFYFLTLSLSFFIVLSSETWEKVNLTFHDNGTLTYNQQKVYIFDPEQSAGSEEDNVVVPNIPMLVSTLCSKPT